jgi:hypothetical protein
VDRHVRGWEKASGRQPKITKCIEPAAAGGPITAFLVVVFLDRDVFVAFAVAATLLVIGLALGSCSGCGPNRGAAATQGLSSRQLNCGLR